MDAEGWYKDPYGRHEERWFSDGTPTQLVRDGQVEAHDPPPDTPAPGPLVRAQTHGAPVGAEDMLRADDAERPADPGQPQITTVLEAVVAPVPDYRPEATKKGPRL